MNESRLIRDRHDAVLDAIDLASTDTLGPVASVLVQTFAQVVYPGAPASVFACNPCEINVAETEGATPVFVADSTKTLFVANLGTAVPDAGTFLIAVGAGGRLSFRFDG